jgi:hypothetical protein
MSEIDVYQGQSVENLTEEQLTQRHRVQLDLLHRRHVAELEAIQEQQRLDWVAWIARRNKATESQARRAEKAQNLEKGEEAAQEEPPGRSRSAREPKAQTKKAG